MNEEEIKTVYEEIYALIKKMKGIVDAGGNAIGCTEVSRHLLRIFDAHVNETGKMRDDFVAMLNSVR